MTPEQLRVRLDRLETEIEHITQRLDRFGRLEQQGADDATLAKWRAKARRLTEQRERLVRLVEEGRRQLLDNDGG